MGKIIKHKQSKLMTEEASVLCRHKREPQSELMKRTGPNFFDQIVSCWYQDQYCPICKDLFYTFMGKAE